MKTRAIPKPRRRRVSFSFEAPRSQHVSLVGSFNSWDPRRHPMKKANSGLWEKTVILEPGTYEYKFFADGRWVEDFQNAQQCSNGFGTRNNIVVVTG